jgi:hypothetical protein
VENGREDRDVPFNEISIVPPIAFRRGERWYRFKTVDELIDGMSKIRHSLDPASPESIQLSGWIRDLVSLPDPATPMLPNDTRRLLVDTLSHLGTIFEHPNFR